MSWLWLRTIWINLSRFVFYDQSDDGTGVLTTPGGPVCFLKSDYREAVDHVFAGDPDPPRWKDHTTPGLAWPNNAGSGGWIETSGGAVNMALADLVEDNEDGRMVIRGGVHQRVYAVEDSDRIRRWLNLYRRGSIV